MVTGTAIHLQVESPVVPDSPEHCLREAEECDRLAGLSQTVATRQILQSVAFHWRKLAERTSERVIKRARRPATGPIIGGARVLVVEDEKALADTLCDLLLAGRACRHRCPGAWPHREFQDRCRHPRRPTDG
jgi:hypothetical protein